MRLCLRLAAPVVLLMAVALGLVYVRTETVRASNHLHALYREKRDLERTCYRLELTIADLKCPQRLREQAARLEVPAEEAVPGPEGARQPLIAGRAVVPRP